MSVYRTGTVALTNGSVDVIGTGTAWAMELIQGGMFSAAGLGVPIFSVDDDTSLKLAYPWPGATASGAGYAIAREYSEAVRAVWTNSYLATIVQRLNLIGIHPDYSGPLIDRDALDPQPDTGKFFLRCAPGESFEFYRKEDSGWSGPYAVVGPAGGTGGSGPAGPGLTPAGEWLVSTTYSLGAYVQHNSRTFASLIAGNTGNQPPNADEDDAFWMYVPTAQGAPGAQVEFNVSATHIQWRYVGEPTWTDLVALADLAGEDGEDGDNGWSPIEANVVDGERRVKQIVDWVGGEGAKPATGAYVGPAGYTPNIAEATDVRGAAGSGGGDVNSTGSITSGRLVIYADGTGDLIQDSGVSVSDLATATQGAKADTAVQPGALGTAAARNVGTASGNVPVLGAGGVLDEAVLPALAITDTFEVANQTAMLALTAQRGDVAVRSDLNKCFILKASPASTLANWVELRTPTDAVLSVAGKTGAVTLVKGDVGLGNVDNTADANKPVSTAQQTALDGKENAGEQVGINTQTGTTYTLVLTDKGKVIEMNNAACIARRRSG